MKGLFAEVIKKMLRVPVSEMTTGEGGAMARQLDVALMSVGFKCSQELLERLKGLHPTTVQNIAVDVLQTVRELVGDGDNLRHNVYFINFPKDVPDAQEFWLQCIIDALFDPKSAATITLQLSCGFVNLLELPKYGHYQHSYEEMVAAHEQFIPYVKDRVTLLHLGKSLPEEALALYHSLAGSSIPLNESDRELLRVLAESCLDDAQPEAIPARENKAIINRVRLDNGRALLADTPTDVLRLACALSDGDVTLTEKTIFKSFPKKARRALMQALNAIIVHSPVKLADVLQYSERWKRLGEKLHPHEYSQFPQAQDVFAVARGDKKITTWNGQVERAFIDDNIDEVIRLLSAKPGVLFRNLDRLLSTASSEEVEVLLVAVQTLIEKVSGRVILSVREHLQNRLSGNISSRIFANSKGRAWVTPEMREPLKTVVGESVISHLNDILDSELTRRLPKIPHLIVDPAVLNVAIPMSNKNKAAGFGILPRGSVSPITGDILRFFIYWKQHSQRTDYDLSALMLGENFQYLGHLSYTRLRDSEDDGNVHSGDITDAPNGASEFVDFNLRTVQCTHIIPQVNIYAGEQFNEIEECFFGFMERAPKQKGLPFEPRTVRMKSELRAKGKVALPLVFIKDENGTWSAKWLHLYLSGQPNMNRVEENRLNTSLLARTIVERNYLRLEYLVNLLQEKAKQITWHDGRQRLPAEPVTYIGLATPEGLLTGSTVITLNNLQDLIPV